MNAKEYLESKGYEFPDKDFWMEDYVTEHKFKDLVQLMEEYHEQKLNIASVSGKRQDELIQAIATQTQIIENLIGGNRVVNLDEAIAYYKSLIAACASGAVDKTVSDGLYCNCTTPNRNTTGNWCGTCNKMIAGNSVGRF